MRRECAAPDSRRVPPGSELFQLLIEPGNRLCGRGDVRSRIMSFIRSLGRGALNVRVPNLDAGLAAS